MILHLELLHMRIQTGLKINIRCEFMKFLKQCNKHLSISFSNYHYYFCCFKKTAIKKEKSNPKTKQENLEVHQNKRH